METRPICEACHQRPCAVNYRRKGVVHWRTKCDNCARKKRAAKALWETTGYVKKKQCERCGFKSKYPQQFSVHYTDGDLLNVTPTNLKTVCANCQIEISITGWQWGDLAPDY